MTTLRSMTPRGERILVALGFYAGVSACDAFADAPRRPTAPEPTPAVRPLPPGATSAPLPFTSSPSTTSTFTSTVPQVTPQPTVTAPAVTTAPPSSLPICPPPTHGPDATSGETSVSADTSGGGFTPSPSVTGDETVTASPGDGGDVRSAALQANSALGDSTALEDSTALRAPTAQHDAGVPVGAGDASPTLPSGDSVVVDDLTLLIIFDNSGSMAECWDGKTRWEHANHALRAAIEPAQHSLKVGAIRFPADVECLVEPFHSENQFAFGVGHEFLADWDAHTRYPIGGTPLAAAMIEADKAIQDAAAAGLLDQRFRVVILTDGEPNCDGSPSLLTTLPTAWRARGVETRVLGLPGSDSAATLLQNIADAGGGVYEQLTTPGELHDSAQRAAR